MKKTLKALLNTDNPYISMLFKLLVILFMIIGIVDTATMGGFMSQGVILYFTVQSNITIAVICFVFLIIDILGIVQKKSILIPKWLYVLKFVFTVAISVTFLVFWTMLMPQMAMTMPAYLYAPSNLFCHTFVPIFAIADWVMFSKEYKAGKGEFVWGIAMPLYYLGFALICSYSGVTFDGTGSKVPYFFLDYEENTWFQLGNGKFGVFWWVLVIIALVLLISLALMAGKKATEVSLYARKSKKEIIALYDGFRADESK